MKPYSIFYFVKHRIKLLAYAGVLLSTEFVTPISQWENDGISVLIWSISVGPIQLILPPPVPQEFLGGKCYFVSGLAFCHCLGKWFKFTVSPICINFSSRFISLLTCSRKYMLLLKQKVNLGMFLLLCSHECCSFVCLPSLLFPLQ